LWERTLDALNHTHYAHYGINVVLGIEEEEELEFLTAVIMKNSVFCDIPVCSPLNVNQRFGGTCRLILQGRRISLARNQRESRWQFLAWLIP
jgi:hypothetical protein